MGRAAQSVLDDVLALVRRAVAPLVDRLSAMRARQRARVAPGHVHRARRRRREPNRRELDRGAFLGPLLVLRQRRHRAREGVVKRMLFVVISRFVLILDIDRSFRKHETLRARGVFV